MLHGIQSHRKHAPHSPDLTAKRKFPDKGGVCKILVVYLTHSGKYRSGNRQIVSRAGLFNVRRSKVDRHPAFRKINAGGTESRSYPFLGLLNSGVCKTYYFKPFDAAADLDLNIHAEGVHSEKTYAFDFREHLPHPPIYITLHDTAFSHIFQHINAKNPPKEQKLLRRISLYQLYQPFFFFSAASDTLTI